MKVIREQVKHFFATYQLVSTLPMKYTEFVRSVGEVIGKDIEIQQVPYTEIVNSVCERTFGAETEVSRGMRDGPGRLVLYYNKGGLIDNPRVLESLLGRPGTTPS